MGAQERAITTQSSTKSPDLEFIAELAGLMPQYALLHLLRALAKAKKNLPPFYRYILLVADICLTEIFAPGQRGQIVNIESLAVPNPPCATRRRSFRP